MSMKVLTTPNPGDVPFNSERLQALAEKHGKSKGLTMYVEEFITSKVDAAGDVDEVRRWDHARNVLPGGLSDEKIMFGRDLPAVTQYDPGTNPAERGIISRFYLACRKELFPDAVQPENHMD